MELRKASRKNAKIKMGLQGPSGSGKTYSALLIAYGLCNDWNKVAVIDTENHSSELYAHLGEFQTLSLTPPFSPEKYVEAIKVCESSGMEVIIIDSMSHEWNESGGVLDIHANLSGNSFTNWAKINPRHNSFIQAILQSACHVIGTIRTKQDYVLVDKNGKMAPEKVGLKSIQREGVDYEFTLVLDIDIKHNCVASKDRTSLFMGKPEFKISTDTGKQILQWCNSGSPVDTSILSPEMVKARINECRSLKDLLALFKAHPNYQQLLNSQFTTKRKELESSNPNEVNSILKQVKQSPNGKH